MVSYSCHVQTPHRVPRTSSQDTTQNAPTNSNGALPHRRNPSRQTAQKAPSASRRVPAKAYKATAITATTVSLTIHRAWRCAQPQAPKSSAAR